MIPLANHTAVVVHTRRLLRETVYLQDYLEQLIEQANALIIATDIEGRVTVWNRAMNRVTGFSRGEVVGKPLLPWLTELGAPDVGRVLKQVAASGTPATREVRLPTVGGAMLRAAFNVVAVRGAAGAPAAVLGIGQDVTALRQLQSQVIHAEKLATLGQIAAGVAHEINNPLTSIQVCAATVARKASQSLDGRVPGSFDAADLDRLRKIEDGAERIRRFARDLVSYARPSGSEVEDIAINEALDQALSFCEHVLESAHATLERDYARDLPRIQAVRDQILQVAINLVTNAAHAVEARGGTVRVRTWVAGGATVGFAISDNGVGIKDEDRGKIFDPFFTTKPAGKGTGLGLSIVRNIIYSHGGQISFQSRPGSGTTFMVTLPVTPLGPPEVAGHEPPQSPSLESTGASPFDEARADPGSPGGRRQATGGARPLRGPGRHRGLGRRWSVQGQGRVVAADRSQDHAVGARLDAGRRAGDLRHRGARASGESEGGHCLSPVTQAPARSSA